MRGNDGARKGQTRARRVEGRSGVGQRQLAGERDRPTRNQRDGTQRPDRRRASASRGASEERRSAMRGRDDQTRSRGTRSGRGEGRTHDGRARGGQPRKRRPQDPRGRAVSGVGNRGTHRRGEQETRKRTTTAANKPLTAAERDEATRKSRRLKTILFLVVATLLAVAATVFIIRYALSKIESHTAPVSPVEQYEPVECSTETLTVTVDRSGSIAGRPMHFTTSLTNTGERPCYFDTDDLRLHITSGDQIIYDTSTCQAGIGSKLLLLDTDLTTNQSLQWNGLNTGANCSTSSVAKPGTYVARIYLGDTELLDSGIVFDLGYGAEPAPAEPQESDESEPAEGESADGEPTESEVPAGSDAPNEDDVQAPTEEQANDPAGDTEG